MEESKKLIIENCVSNNKKELPPKIPKSTATKNKQTTKLKNVSKTQSITKLNTTPIQNNQMKIVRKKQFSKPIDPLFFFF